MNMMILRTLLSKTPRVHQHAHPVQPEGHGPAKSCVTSADEHRFLVQSINPRIPPWAKKPPQTQQQQQDSTDLPRAATIHVLGSFRAPIYGFLSMY